MSNVLRRRPGGGTGPLTSFFNSKSASRLGGSGSPANGRRIILIIAPFIALLILLNFFVASGNGILSLLPSSRSSLLARHDGVHWHRPSTRNKQASNTPNQDNNAFLSGVSRLNFSGPPPYSFCPIGSAGDELTAAYGREPLYATRAHVGSTERIRRVLRRAMEGSPITLAILGGSVSACQGLDSTAQHPLGNPVGPNGYPHRVLSWINDVFPHPANELTNGALRRTGTDYFSYCSELHLPDKLDIVILEFDTDDPYEVDTVQSMDLLVRSLLLRKDSPAIIMLGHFSPQFQGEFGYAGPEMFHTTVAQFYDVPHLSTKGLLYRKYMLHPHEVRRQYYLDPVLASAKGHEILADTVIHFLESETCKLWEEGVNSQATDTSALSGAGAGGAAAFFGAGGAQGGSPLDKQGAAAAVAGDDQQQQPDLGLSDPLTSEFSRKNPSIPPFRVYERPQNFKHHPEVSLWCSSANDLINPLPESIFAGSGWTPMAPSSNAEQFFHSWYSNTPGSLISVPIRCQAGTVAVHYVKGPASEGWGEVLCWVDDNTEGAFELRGSWERDHQQPIVTNIDQGVSPGSHQVHCELQGQPNIDQVQFKLLGVFAT